MDWKPKYGIRVRVMLFQVLQEISVENPDKSRVGFQIQIPELRPDSYSISPAVANGNIWQHSIEDWIDNAYIVNLVDSGLVYGMMRWSVQASYRWEK